jgi:phage baseplate assembly protein V
MDFDSDSVFPVNRTGRDSEIRNMFRHGKVTEVLVDNTQVCCRVQYLDKDGLISKPLPVKQFGSRSTSSFWCPKIGDDVSVTMLPNADEDGFIDGSFYNTGNPPPVTNPNSRHVTHEDGAIFDYTEGQPMGRGRSGSGGTLTISGIQSVSVTAGTITIKATTIILDATDVKITGTLWVDKIKPYQASEITATPHMKNADGSGNGS